MIRHADYIRTLRLESVTPSHQDEAADSFALIDHVKVNQIVKSDRGHSVGWRQDCELRPVRIMFWCYC